MREAGRPTETETPQPLTALGGALRYKPWLWLLSLGLALAAALLFVRLPGRWPTRDILLGLGLSMIVLAVARAVHVAALERELLERQRLIDELSAARGALAAGERRAGVLEERQRLARDIHDTLAQGLTGILLHLRNASAALPDHAPLAPARRSLSLAEDAARQALEEARRFLAALRPEALEQAALPDAIARVAQKLGEDAGLAVRVAIAAVPRLRPEAEVTLLRAAQEALSNARKHAAASAVSVRLACEGSQVVLEVSDDGRGLSSAADPTGGFGLRALRERVAELAGALTLDSRPGAGLTLRVTLPMNPPLEPAP